MQRGEYHGRSFLEVVSAWVLPLSWGRCYQRLLVRCERRETTVNRTPDATADRCDILYSREIPRVAQGASAWLSALCRVLTYPLVKTFSNDVFPQAPSPLSTKSFSQ